MSETVIYNGVDISAKVSSAEVVHDMYAENTQADTMTLVFEDKEAEWDAWGAAPGDTIAYQNGGTKSGTMYVLCTCPSDGFFTIYAASVPQDASARNTKSWENAYLTQIGAEVAERFGFSFRIAAGTDWFYQYAAQENEKDISFLARLARQEGFCLVAYEGEIIFYDEKQLEERDAGFSLDASGCVFSAGDLSGYVYGAAEVRCGAVYGAYTADAGNSRILKIKERYATTDSEAARWAKNNLRAANRAAKSCRMKVELMQDIAAGVCVNVVNSKDGKWSGKMFAYHVRHEYTKKKTTIFLRKPLEGY